MSDAREGAKTRSNFEQRNLGNPCSQLIRKLNPIRAPRHILQLRAFAPSRETQLHPTTL